MALDATIGGANADTYGTIAEADAYFTGRGNSTWTGTDAVKEAALRTAAAYLDNVYQGKWKGLRVNELQARSWPRVDVLDYDGFYVSSLIIPRQVKNAQFEAALLLLTGVALEGTINRAVKREKVDVIEVEYSDGAALTAQYPQITNWLNGLVIGGAGNGGWGSSRIVRG
jgi:hypothetical protein